MTGYGHFALPVYKPALRILMDYLYYFLILRKLRRNLQKMLNLRTTDATHSVSGIQKLAKQVLCYVEDMECVGERDNLLRLPIPPIPEPVQMLNKALHEKMARPIFKWATERGFEIEREISHGPTVLWLQGGGITCPSDMVSILVFVQRPTPKHSGGAVVEVTGGGEGLAARQEPPFMGEVRTPITDPLFCSSMFECQVGDILLLEGGEKLVARRGIEPCDVCMFCVMHRTTPRKGAAGENAA
ncbi:hypothetical protein B0H63DRAFT_473576 [Podospora didyma]|uniref:Uncharacterized protein n=1 Tax=Podospora didyma TaxID=330526 RepID=A0AAE0NQG7_9PEZI|nr:hypothetical protein B0H63DRAFT_473576 [Podospora didyma]